MDDRQLPPQDQWKDEEESDDEFPTFVVMLLIPVGLCIICTYSIRVFLRKQFVLPQNNTHEDWVRREWKLWAITFICFVISALVYFLYNNS